jgi:integral membrane protein (TIGR00529 family)
MIEFLLSIPAYIKVGVSFAGILLLNRLSMSLGLAIILCSLALSLWSGTGIQGLVFQAKGFGRPENYLLPVVIFLLLFFTESLNKTGRMERTITTLKSWLKSKKMLLAGLPALVGLLPMPGGAIFSAPLVASLDSPGELDARQRVAINYWFRHIWEYWWPLYPGVILAVRYSELPAATFFLIQIPFTFAALLGGYVFILKKTKRGNLGNSENGKIEFAAVFSALGPIGILVIVSVLGSAVLPKIGFTGTLSSLLSMLIGLIIAIALVFSGNSSAWKASLGMLKQTGTWQMILLVISILAFSATIKAPLDAAGTTLVTLMRDEFINAGIPLAAVIMLIPFISGMATGVAFGFVGASFPIVFALVGQNPSLGVTAATTACAYAFGYMGMMLSPIHVCFVVTCEYFKTPLFDNYRYLIGPVVTILIIALILSGLYYTLM